MATTISTEARAFSNAGRAGLDYWTPNINPYRDPRWGRGMETPGEDPRRIRGYVAALLAGLEGDDDAGPRGKKKILATCKHYAGNDIDRWANVVRHNFSATISTQELVEYHLPGFRQCARDSKVSSFMCAYNAVNGTPACANTYLMQTVLREHWGWRDEDQYVTSDCNAVENIFADHRWAATAAEAAAAAYNAGTDTVCEFGSAVTDVLGAWEQGLLAEETVDRALRRLYGGLVRVGYFDPAEDDPYRALAWEDVNTEEAQALALQSAVDGIVLLKNNGALPLAYAENTSVAVIGHWADSPTQMLGGYSGTPPYWLTPRYVAEAIHGSVHYAPGPVTQSADNDTWSESAVEAARSADVVFYFGGLDLTVEREDRDRTDIGWPDAQLSLINKICALGKPCVVMQLGTQVDDTPLLENDNVSAILWAGYPGQAGGAAVFDIIYGKSAPAGRLPVTQYPASYAEVPMTEMSLRPGDSNPGRTYKFYDDSVLPFGYGLHYTTFDASFESGPEASYEIEDLLAACDDAEFLDLCPFATVTLTVENTGDLKSDYVGLVFVSGAYGPEPRPLKELVGYQRLRGIEPDGSADVEVSLTLGDIARVDEVGNTVLYPGEYTLQLDVPVQDTVKFEITGKEAVLDEWPQPPEDLGGGVHPIEG